MLSVEAMKVGEQIVYQTALLLCTTAENRDDDRQIFIIYELIEEIVVDLHLCGGCYPVKKHQLVWRDVFFRI